MGQTSADSRTQRTRILDLLVAARGGWVSLPEILACGAAQYGARLHELRRLGHRIDNRTERRDGKRNSYFRLVVGPTISARTSSISTPGQLRASIEGEPPSREATAPPDSTTNSLFGDLNPLRYPD